MVSIRKSDNEKMEKINYHGSVNVINAAIANKAKKLVYVSSSHVIGYKDGAPIKESDFGMKTENIGAYETSKKKATEYVFMKASEGLNASVVFPSGIVSDNDKAMGEISTLLYKLSTGKLTYYPRGGYAFVDVHDVARGIIAASKVGKKGEGYLLSGGYLSLDEIDSIVRERYPNLKKGRVIPFFFAYLGLPFIMIHEKISHHKPLYTYTSLKTIRTHALFDTSKAQKELGITFTPLKTSINNALSYIEKTAPKK
jgi:dihydroflavonol-4-reductase